MSSPSDKFPGKILVATPLARDGRHGPRRVAARALERIGSPAVRYFLVMLAEAVAEELDKTSPKDGKGRGGGRGAPKDGANKRINSNPARRGVKKGI